MSFRHGRRVVALFACVVLLAGRGTASAQEFGYSGELGPGSWHELSAQWATCRDGDTQSPIDFGEVPRLSRTVRRLPVTYGTTSGAIFNNGHTIEVETEGDNALVLDRVHYDLVQLHFHTPSEHRVNRRGFDMEMHLVHRSAAGGTAVVGVFLQRGATSGPLAVVFENLPALDAPPNTRKALPSFDLSAFLPSSRVHYRYLGSLTTPPCTEGVHWLVLETLMTVSDEDMAQFTRRVPFNARLVQRRSR